jgi:hypothetical protein
MIMFVVAAVPLSSALLSRNNSTDGTTSTGVNGQTSVGPVIDNYVPGPGCVSSPGLQLQKGDLSLVALLMYQGSSASFCVSYIFEPVQSQTVVNFQEYAYAFLVTATTVDNNNASGFSYSKTPAPGISISADPSSIILEPSASATNQVQVEYTITASPNARGFFSLNYLDSCPAFIPFSVGYGTLGVNATDYHGFFMPSNCVWMVSPLAGIPQIVGYGGMGTTLITAASEMS